MSPEVTMRALFNTRAQRREVIERYGAAARRSGGWQHTLNRV